MLAAAADSKESTRLADKKPARPANEDLGLPETAVEVELSSARFLNLRSWCLHFEKGGVATLRPLVEDKKQELESNIVSNMRKSEVER